MSAAETGYPYVYGLARADAVGSVEAPAVLNPETGFSWVIAGDIAALTSVVDTAEIMSTRRNMLAHAKVLETAMAQRAILPMRFGVVADTEAALIAAITPKQDALIAELGRLDGHVEIGVKVTWSRETAMAAVLRDDPALAGERDALQGEDPRATHFARIELGRKVGEALAARRGDAEAAWLNRLTPLAVDHVVHSTEEDLQVLRAAFLVRTDEEGAFAAAVEAASDDEGPEASVKYVGPAPVYNFVSVVLPAVDAAPAAAA